MDQAVRDWHQGVNGSTSRRRLDLRSLKLSESHAYIRTRRSSVARVHLVGTGDAGLPMPVVRVDDRPCRSDPDQAVSAQKQSKTRIRTLD